LEVPGQLLRLLMAETPGQEWQQSRLKLELKQAGIIHSMFWACHLCHGQGITRQPREVLEAIPGLTLVELENATHCCGSAGVYNITQPEQAAKLQAEKIACIVRTGASVVATANPGCHLQIQNGLGGSVVVKHPVSLLAEAYRAERERAWLS
jgi:glycolate oxidase iron-sulfur subunit